MDSGKDHLLVAGPGEGYLLADLRSRTASHPPSGIGDDTVAAELVAAILYFT